MPAIPATGSTSLPATALAVAFDAGPVPRRALAAAAIALAAAAMALPATSAQGAEWPTSERSRAYVVTRDAPDRPSPRDVHRVAIEPVDARASHVVFRPVVEPAATVSRALAEQPTFLHLAEVRLNQTTILVDPEKPLRRLDESHEIRRAQRMFLSRQALPARVIRPPHASQPRAERLPRDLVVPRAVFFRPDALDRQPGPAPAPERSPAPAPARPRPDRHPEVLHDGGQPDRAQEDTPSPRVPEGLKLVLLD
ncbi:MAG: hypothetical protein WD009_13695 [Phycisphaeraceae bacterium]